VEEVVEKRLKLAEEVRVTKQHTTRYQPHAITLRRQSMVVERLPGSDDDKLD
jgi:stress response protein YsnF